MLVHAYGMARQVHWPAKYLNVTGPYALDPLFAHNSSSLNYLNVSLLPLGLSLNNLYLVLCQSQNALPLHPIMCAIHFSSNPFQSKKCSGIQLSWWVLGLDLWAEPLWDSPGKGSDCVSSSVLNLGSYLHFASLGLWKWDSLGLMALVMNLAGYCLGFSSCHCL